MNAWSLKWPKRQYHTFIATSFWWNVSSIFDCDRRREARFCFRVCDYSCYYFWNTVLCWYICILIIFVFDISTSCFLTITCQCQGVILNLVVTVIQANSLVGSIFSRYYHWVVTERCTNYKCNKKWTKLQYYFSQKRCKWNIWSSKHTVTSFNIRQQW